jgi:hypothetical protein
MWVFHVIRQLHRSARAPDTSACAGTTHGVGRTSGLEPSECGAGTRLACRRMNDFHMLSESTERANRCGTAADHVTAETSASNTSSTMPSLLRLAHEMVQSIDVLSPLAQQSASLPHLHAVVLYRTRAVRLPVHATRPGNLFASYESPGGTLRSQTDTVTDNTAPGYITAAGTVEDVCELSTLGAHELRFEDAAAKACCHQGWVDPARAERSPGRPRDIPSPGGETPTCRWRSAACHGCRAPDILGTSHAPDSMHAWAHQHACATRRTTRPQCIL